MKEWVIAFILIGLCVAVAFYTVATYPLPPEDLTAGASR